MATNTHETGTRSNTDPAISSPLLATLGTCVGIVAVVLVATTVFSLLVVTLTPAASGPVQAHGLSGSGPSFTGFAGQPADPSTAANETGTLPVSTPTETDVDAARDGIEHDCPHLLPDADPGGQDIYVEVDATGNNSLDDGTAERLETIFANAPVAHENGDAGIRLHLVEGDTGLPEPGPVDIERGPGDHDDVWDYRSSYFEHDGAGYYYLLLTSAVEYEGDDSYAGAGGNGTALVETYDSEAVMTSLIMHELGHAFGISHDDPGVDSFHYTREEYESVMNYNAIYDVHTYADGDGEVGRDEWQFIAQDRHVPTIESPDAASCGAAP